MVGNSDSRERQNTEPDQLLAGDPLFKDILLHKQKLEEIRKKLHPDTLEPVLIETVKNPFIPDIGAVFRYLESVEDKKNLLPYISDPDLLRDKLDEILLVLKKAIRAWNKSEAQEGVKEQLDAEFIYDDLLNTCYGLLNEALTYFILVEQAQQGTSTKGNTQSMRK